MRAKTGDRLVVDGNVVGRSVRTGEIVEVRNAGGEPPYLVRWADGREALCYPGPDAHVEHTQSRGRRKP